MKKIAKNELFENVKGFLKSKGVQLEEGTYTRRVEKGCGVLTKAINMTQEAVKQTKAEVEAKLDQVRQSIHEKTAPKSAAAPAPASPPPTATEGVAKSAASKTGQKDRRSRKSPLHRPARRSRGEGKSAK
jgi:hypothetical protein